MPSFLPLFFFILLIFNLSIISTSAFGIVFLAKRAKGGLTRSLNDDKPESSQVPNRGKGQEITGVTLPIEGKLRGWEFGEGKRMACGNVNGKLYAIEGECPRCGFDLWKGDLLFDDPAWDDLPRVACPTCSATFSLRTGKQGPMLKRNGLRAFVGGLAKQATSVDSNKSAKVYQITRDEEDGRVFCRER